MDNQKKRKATLHAFFKAKEPTPTNEEHNSVSVDIPNSTNAEVSDSVNVDIPNCNKEQACMSPTVEIDINSLELDPGLRIPIWKYPVNQRDEIRRAYIKRGPYQPIQKEYEAIASGVQRRRFQSHWFDEFPWLEYSPVKNAAFFFPCYLFETDYASHNTFTSKGFNYWKRVHDGERCAFVMHVGKHTSSHSKAMNSMELLKGVTRHVDRILNTQSLEEIQKSRLRLKITIEISRWLSLQACAFRGHDESFFSDNRGNFLEMINLIGTMNANIMDLLETSSQNAKYTSKTIFNEIVYIFGDMVRSKIRAEVDDAKFCILVDEAKDISNKEQMAIVLRFVNAGGFIQERFFAIVQVSDTSAVTLKKSICDVLEKYNLQINNLRGQGYDGASNMRGSWNGLQALFMRDCPYAYYVHCFAHRLQLALVAADEKDVYIWLFFSKLTTIVNIMNGSPKRLALLQSAQQIEIAQMVESGERDTGKGINQIGAVQRACKTRWSSHFDSICSIIEMFGSVIVVLQNILVDENSPNSIRGEAAGCLSVIRSFDFVFILHLMQKITGITNLLCEIVQTKALDILNAMEAVESTKVLLQSLRNEGFDVLLYIVKSCCLKHDIEMPCIEDSYKSATGRASQQKDFITVDYHYRIDIFNAVIDFQVEEISGRFNDKAVELLKLSSALEPRDNFKSYNPDDICALAKKYYSGDFSEQDMYYLKVQLEHYKHNVVEQEKFHGLSTISELCVKLAETNKSVHYNLIDRLIRLVLTLPVSTATTKPAFSAMKIVKSVLRNKMNEDFLADSLVINIERQLAKDIDVDTELLNLGAKRIGVVGIPPIGCVPSQRTLQGGILRFCNPGENMMSQLFNSRLDKELQSLKAKHPQTLLVLADIYGILYDMIQRPTNYGFEVSTRGCCGTGKLEVSVLCNSLTSSICSNVSKYVFWDSYHPTEGAYETIVDFLYKKYIHLLI